MDTPNYLYRSRLPYYVMALKNERSLSLSPLCLDLHIPQGWPTEYVLNKRKKLQC